MTRVVPFPFGVKSSGGSEDVTISAPAGHAGFNGFVPEVVIPAESRILIHEDDFSSGYENRFPNRTQWVLTSDEGRVVSRDFGMLNGHGAVTLTFPANSSPDVRHHLVCNMLGGPYEEFFFTQQFRFESNYCHGPENQARGTMKMISIHPVAGAGSPGGGNPCPTNQWGTRNSTRAGPGVGFIPEGKVSCERYFEHPDQPTSFARESHWPQFLDVETLYEIEYHWKLNSASSVADGFWHVDVNGARVSDQDPDVPENFYWYCNGEGGRANCRAEEIRWEFFYGGAGDGWEPFRDSSWTLGYWKLEVPA